MRKIIKFLKTDGRDVAVNLVGCVIVGISFSFFTYPNNIVSGGLTGISQIINLLTGSPVGILIIVMNIPLFAVAWKKFGLRFIIYSLIGMVGSSVAIDLFNLLNISLTDDILLAAVYGGLLRGLGYGLIFTSGGTSGGTDIVSRMLRRKYAFIPLGTIGLVLDVIVVAAFAIIFKRMDAAMYTIITIFVASRMINLLLYGTANSSICYIITTSPHDIANQISKSLRRGATLLKGEGAYSGDERDVVLCAVKRHQIPTLKRVVSSIDKNAFVIVTQSHEVFGQNFQNIEKID
ncbi:MAG: YitT family protein [Oscillospiraceae bacterium]|nr:YitT family protein [Oscillospiraceae bacterium]